MSRSTDVFDWIYEKWPDITGSEIQGIAEELGIFAEGVIESEPPEEDEDEG